MLIVSMTFALYDQSRHIGLAGLGPLWWVGPNGIYGMWYFGELTKLCAYGFYGYGFRYFRFEREGPDLIATHPSMSPQLYDVGIIL